MPCFILSRFSFLAPKFKSVYEIYDSHVPVMYSCATHARMHHCIRTVSNALIIRMD